VSAAPVKATRTHADQRCRQDPEEAAKDFRARIKNYEKVYETIDESEKALTYVKITNIG
jgi:6-phosphofructo-2-kinase / fructose-2,6-biphosphatase 2